MAERRTGPGLALLLVLALAGPAGAESGTEILFSPGQLGGVAAGETLVYAHDRAAMPEALAPAASGTWRLAVETRNEARAALLSIGREGRTPRLLDPFPAGEEAGNPVLMAFLETVTRRIAEASGGSPFYIRNRIRDAFRAGGEVGPAAEGPEDARRIAYRPFEGDPNAARLGPFAGLSLAFTVADSVPGRLLSLTAETAGADPAYRETLRLVPGAPNPQEDPT